VRSTRGDLRQPGSWRLQHIRGATIQAGHRRHHIQTRGDTKPPDLRERAETDRACLVGMLGGPEHTTLFLLPAEWRGLKHVNETVAARTGQVLVMQAPAPGAGLP
jgi:hypothetical protein